MTTIKNVLIVDDDEVYVFLAKKIIEKTNLVDLVRVCTNGRDAMQFLRENINNPDLLPEIILLDLSMPIMDGWQFLEEFLILKPKAEKKITIYVVSSSISPDDIERAKNINDVSEYVIKPVPKEKFMEMFKKILLPPSA